MAEEELPIGLNDGKADRVVARVGLAERLLEDREFLNAYNRSFIDGFRANGGKALEGPLAGVPALLLGTVGSKSGKPRINPLSYHEIGGRWYVVGSFSGGPNDPAWAHNLRACPQATVEVGDHEGVVRGHRVTARELPRDERDQLWARLIALSPNFAEYQAKTDRVIPLFELVKRDVPRADRGRK